MNLFESFGSGDEAVVEYGDGEFHIIKPGAYVVCAVTSERIPLKALRYWNVDTQEAYKDAAAAKQGFGLTEETS
ncbi:MAG: DUF2093 domain-containing protein [Pseudomonadota bacterium]